MKRRIERSGVTAPIRARPRREGIQPQGLMSLHCLSDGGLDA